MVWWRLSFIVLSWFRSKLYMFSMHPTNSIESPPRASHISHAIDSQWEERELLFLSAIGQWHGCLFKSIWQTKKQTRKQGNGLILSWWTRFIFQAPENQKEIRDLISLWIIGKGYWVFIQWEVQRCNGITAGLGYLEVSWNCPCISSFGQSAAVRTADSLWGIMVQCLFWMLTWTQR